MNNLPEENTAEEEEENEPAIDFWSDEGARRYNEALDEGSTYVSPNPHASLDPEMEIDEEETEYRHPDFYDPEEETLPPGEMEIIFANCYIEWLQSPQPAQWRLTSSDWRRGSCRR